MDARFRGHDDESITPAAVRRPCESGGPWIRTKTWMAAAAGMTTRASLPPLPVAAACLRRQAKAGAHGLGARRTP